MKNNLIIYTTFIVCALGLSSCKDNVKYGYSETERHIIYDQYDSVTKLAVDIAEEYYPKGNETKETTERWIGLRDSIKSKYYTDLAKTKNITVDQLDSIIIEGINKKWPSIFD